MSLKPIHGDRLGKLTTPLGPDTLLLSRFSGTEALSELFQFSVEATSDKEDLNFDSVIGSNCTIDFLTVYNEKRQFDGICTETVFNGAEEGGFGYSLILRPWLWILEHRVTQKIFANKTVIDIISEVFGDYGSLAQFESRVTKSYPTLEYTVQYNESDLNFVLRLLQRFGISFYFEHADGEHKLILCDGISAFLPLSGDGGKRDYYPDDAQNRRQSEHLGTIRSERRFISGKVETLDYNFKKPSSDMTGREAGNNAFENGQLEIFEYPAKHIEKSEGQDIAKIRQELLTSADHHFFATGNCISLMPGNLITVEKHPAARLNTEYLALSCTHSFVAESYSSGGGGSDAEAYSGAYELLPSQTPIPSPITRKPPSVRGAQTARVVGEGEIDCDEHGRILVLFHWDREKAKSMRCRVAQMWAGNKWGSMFIPRVGMEVVVEFVEGDPDKPLVIGCVYNGNNKPPYDLPGKKNIAGIKSESTEGGGGYNEYVFDDTKGKELIRQHAQYDMETKVLHDERRSVNVNRSKSIGNDQFLDVGRDQKAKIGRHDKLDVGRTLTVTAGEKITLKVGQSTIVMDGTSIEMKSPNITINAGMALETNGGLTADHNSGGVLTIKSPLVKIN